MILIHIFVFGHPNQFGLARVGVSDAVLYYYYLNDLTSLFVKYSQLMGEITYEMKDMAYCYRIVEVPADFFSLSADITRWLSEVENCKVSES